MTRVNLFRFLSRIGLGPSHAAIARQLRRPSGLLAGKVARAMNQSNIPLYAFLLDHLRLQHGDRLLEIGFGNGKTFPGFFHQEPGIRVTGLDYSETMVRSARKNNTKLIGEGRLDLHVGSSDRMPFPDETFDKVCCINVLYFWDDPGAHLREVLRVLKPGGSFYPVIRSRKSMELVPFTRHGFLLKEDQEWADILLSAGFATVDIRTCEEPTLQLNEVSMKPDSICLIAGKRE